ncbi:MAG TPA: SRPBCC family protein [Jatrophihabitans sp.]|nr:SRPBCC family protein [Jatrophihabitans sp.]
MVEAEPAAIWRTVSDVRRTGEWSPECRRVIPLGRVRAGTLLLGFNRRGRVWWATVSRIVRFEPEREIAWKVLTNRAVWSYTIEARPDAAVLVQTRRTPQGESGFALAFTRLLLGGQDVHDDELEAGMLAGLRRIAELVTREAH